MVGDSTCKTYSRNIYLSRVVRDRRQNRDDILLPSLTSSVRVLVVTRLSFGLVGGRSGCHPQGRRPSSHSQGSPVLDTVVVEMGDPTNLGFLLDSLTLRFTNPYLTSVGLSTSGRSQF